MQIALSETYVTQSTDCTAQDDGTRKLKQCRRHTTYSAAVIFVTATIAEMSLALLQVLVARVYMIVVVPVQNPMLPEYNDEIDRWYALYHLSDRGSMHNACCIVHH